MRRVDYSAVVRGVAALMAERSDGASAADGLARHDWYVLRDGLNEELSFGWQADRWPDLMRVEKRYFRRLAVAGESVAAGAERFVPETWTYYQALKATTDYPVDSDGEVQASWAACAASYSGEWWDASTEYAVGDAVHYGVDDEWYQMHTSAAAGTVPTDGSAWGALRPFEPVIEYEQTLAGDAAATAIGTVYGAYSRNPRVFSTAPELGFELTEGGVRIGGSAECGRVTSAWLEFRLQVPELTGDDWDSEATYAVGEQVYYADATSGVGNFYECVAAAGVLENPADFPAKWELVELPWFLKRFLVAAGYAFMLKADGQLEKAGALQMQAREALVQEGLRLRGQSGQVRRPRVRAY